MDYLGFGPVPKPYLVTSRYAPSNCEMCSNFVITFLRQCAESVSMPSLSATPRRRYGYCVVLTLIYDRLRVLFSIGVFEFPFFCCNHYFSSKYLVLQYSIMYTLIFTLFVIATLFSKVSKVDLKVANLQLPVCYVGLLSHIFPDSRVQHCNYATLLPTLVLY